MKARKISQPPSQEYLYQAGKRKIIHTVVSTLVTKVLFKDEKSAIGNVVLSGVEFVLEGKMYTARTNQEVILSSG